MRDAKLKAIHQQQIDYVNNSGLTVHVVEIYGTVSIEKRDGSTLVFLDETEGSEFISAAKRDWNEFEDITMSEAYELQAYKYADIDS